MPTATCRYLTGVCLDLIFCCAARYTKAFVSSGGEKGWERETVEPVAVGRGACESVSGPLGRESGMLM